MEDIEIKFPEDYDDQTKIVDQYKKLKDIKEFFEMQFEKYLFNY